MRRLAIYVMTSAIVAITAALSGGCTRHDTRKPAITVSIQPQKYFLEKIAGNKWEVKCLLSNGANPESYDPAMTHLLNLEKSKAYFRMGNIPFESAIINKVHNNNPALRIYDTSEGIDLISGTHFHGDIGHAGAPDPHTWSSVKNARTIAANMLAAIVELDPGNKGYYTRNYRRLAASLDSLDSVIGSLLAPCRGMAFAVWHPSLSYFARDYGLRQIVLSPEGKEASIAMLQASVDSAVSHDVKVMFFQKELDSKQAVTANEQIDAEIVEINPLSYDWDKEMLHIADALSRP